MKKKKFGIVTFSSEQEKALRKDLYKLFKKCPIPDNEFLDNLGLFLNSKMLSRIFFMNEIYKKIIDVGVSSNKYMGKEVFILRR